jgi:hypothetical protein
MATYSAVFVPNKDNSASPIALTSGAGATSVTIGKRILFAIDSDQDFHISFSNGAGTCDATNFRVPADLIAEFDMSDYYDTINLFQNSGSTGNVWILFLSRA